MISRSNAFLSRGLFLLGVPVALALAGCGKPPPEPEPVRAVRTQTVQLSQAGGTKEFAAEVRARVESRLSFRVGGKLVRRDVEVGQIVKAGQVLAQLDPEDLRQAKDVALAGLSAAQSNFDMVSAEYRRYKDLRDQGFISAFDLERREAGVSAAKSQLDQAKAQATMQRNQAAYSSLLANTAGVVTAVEVEPGAVVTPGTTVVRLAVAGPRDVVFSVPEDGAVALKAMIGKPDALRVKFWGGTDVANATLRELAASADPVTRTFLAKAELGDAAVQLGQTATVLIDLPRVQGVVKLPLSALTQSQDKTIVWVVDKASMSLRAAPVVVAGAEGNEAVINSGLVAGQEVVVAGAHVLVQGQKVKLYDAGPAPAANSASTLAPRH